MIIIMENIHADIVTIPDLGTQLESNESVDMLSNYTRHEILESQDLETIWDNGFVVFTIDGTPSTLVQVIKAITGMTEIEHENLDTLKHGLSEKAYFTVERNIQEDVEKIVHYTDNTKVIKIREDEIVRNINEDVIQLIKRQYDSSGTIIKVETQTINRNVDGEVESIETETV